MQAAHAADATDPRCACSHFQADDAAAAPPGYDTARAAEFNAAEAGGAQLPGGAEAGAGGGRAEGLGERVVLAARLRSCHERPQAEAQAQLARLARDLAAHRRALPLSCPPDARLAAAPAARAAGAGRRGGAGRRRAPPAAAPAAARPRRSRRPAGGRARPRR